jgi:rhamnosyltransferase
MSPPKVCAIVPTFDPGSQVLRCVESLVAQVAQIVAVDDGSEACFEPLLRDLESRGVHVVREGANRGIATALNRGVHWAITQGFEWVITFDQDSAAPADLVASLFAALTACPDSARVAMVGPRILHPDGRHQVSSNAQISRPVRQLLTSGCLTCTAALRDVGYFDERYFIDRVDFEICARLRSAGYLLLESPQVVLRHAPGRTLQLHVLGCSFRLQSHNYKRRYYMARNTVWLARRYILGDPLWVLRRIGVLAGQIAAIAVFEDDKRRKLVASRDGIRDGLSGRSEPRFADMRVAPRERA